MHQLSLSEMSEITSWGFDGRDERSGGLIIFFEILQSLSNYHICEKQKNRKFSCYMHVIGPFLQPGKITLQGIVPKKRKSIIIIDNLLSDFALRPTSAESERSSHNQTETDGYRYRGYPIH